MSPYPTTKPLPIRQHQHNKLRLHPTNLRHTRTTRPHTATHTSEAQEGEHECSRERSPEEPHEGGAGLDLAAPLAVVVAAPADPRAALVRVCAVGSAERGREDDGADEGEEGRRAVEREDDDGDRNALNKGRDEAVEDREPREDSDEHGEVDAGHVAILIEGDDIADERCDEQDPEELESSEQHLPEIHIDGLICFDVETVLMSVIEALKL